MFSLILVTISIVLIAAVSAASLYYGAISFKGASSAISVISLLNQAQQIEHSMVMAQLESPGAKEITPSLPRPPSIAYPGYSWSYDPVGLIYLPLNQADAIAVCNLMTKNGGINDTSDSWSDPQSVLNILQASGYRYGCIGDPTASIPYFISLL
jgi:type II secretory pathway pseudopilin PulG